MRGSFGVNLLRTHVRSQANRRDRSENGNCRRTMARPRGVMRERLLARAAIAGFAVGVIGLALVARSSGDGSPSRLPALSLGGAGTESKTAALSLPEGVIEYRVRGSLPDLPSRARAWSLGQDGDTSRVEQLARALGLSGPVQTRADGWTVTAGGRSLRVERQAGLPWYFGPEAGNGAPCTVPAMEPGAPATGLDTPVASGECASSGGGAVGSTGSTGSSSVTATTATTAVICPSVPPCPPGSACPTVACQTPEPVPEPQRSADLPTRGQAEAAARVLLAKADVDLDGARVRVEDAFSQWRVDVDPLVGGLPTFGFTTGVSVGPKGAIVGANGWLAQPEQGDEYPLVTASVGLERLKQSPFGIGPRPLIAGAPYCEACETQPPQVRTITGVRVGLAFAPLVEPDKDGRALLVPVLLFDIGDGGTVPVLAVADEFLPKPAPDAKPRPEPGPATTEPATQPATRITEDASTTTAIAADGGPAASGSVDPAPR